MDKVGHRTRQLSCKVLYWFTTSTKRTSLSCGNMNGFFANLINAPSKYGG
jgi:hypothetical protein